MIGKGNEMVDHFEKLNYKEIPTQFKLLSFEVLTLTSFYTISKRFPKKCILDFCQIEFQLKRHNQLSVHLSGRIFEQLLIKNVTLKWQRFHQKR